MAKKIGAILSISIIGILIIATIIMANVNVKYNIDCATPTYVYVSYKSNDPSKERDANEKASTIVSYINNASQEKALTALFNGTLNKKPNIVTASSVGKTLPSNEGFFVRYRYENQQKLVDNNGKEVYYDDLVFVIKDLEGVNVVNVYVIPDAQNAKTYTHYYEVEADYSALYEYLVANNFNI